jgi:hypothetical protein
LGQLEGTEKKKFHNATIAEKATPCPLPCPFSTLHCYLSIIPDPDGSGRSMQMIGNKTLSDLSLFRASTNAAVSRLTLNKVGINNLRDSPKRMNELLPEEIQVENPTGHSGRATMISAAVNSGCDATIVSKASKHKDPSMLQRYFHPDVKAMQSPALAVASSFKMQSPEEKEAPSTSTTPADEEYEEYQEWKRQRLAKPVPSTATPTGSSLSTASGKMITINLNLN